MQVRPPPSSLLTGGRVEGVEAAEPHVGRTVASSQRPSPRTGASVGGVPASRAQHSGEQPQESARPPRVVRGSSAPTGTRTLSLTPRLASQRIVAARERPVPVSTAITMGHEGGRSAHSPSLALCEWMRSRAPDAQESPRTAQSHPCSRGCTPLRQRPTATWPTPCASCASSVGAPVACWLAPSLLAQPQPQVVVQSPGRRCRDDAPQWPRSVCVPVVTHPLAAWSGVLTPHGSTSLLPASPLSSGTAPCSGCAGLRPPPGLASCPLILPPAYLQPPSGLGVPAPP